MLHVHNGQAHAVIAFEKHLNAIDTGENQGVIVVNLDKRMVKRRKAAGRPDLDSRDFNDFSPQLPQRVRQSKSLVTGAGNKNAPASKRNVRSSWQNEYLVFSS